MTHAYYWQNFSIDKNLLQIKSLMYSGPLLSNSSIILTLNNEKMRFYPRISVVIADWPEVLWRNISYVYGENFCNFTDRNISKVS
jgi:hypothetical protein